MPESLKERIRAAAAIEKRTMANWCAYHLERLMNEMEMPGSGSTKSKPLESLEDPHPENKTHAR